MDKNEWIKMDIYYLFFWERLLFLKKTKGIFLVNWHLKKGIFLTYIFWGIN